MNIKFNENSKSIEESLGISKEKFDEIECKIAYFSANYNNNPEILKHVLNGLNDNEKIYATWLMSYYEAVLKLSKYIVESTQKEGSDKTNVGILLSYGELSDYIKKRTKKYESIYLNKN